MTTHFETDAWFFVGGPEPPPVTLDEMPVVVQPRWVAWALIALGIGLIAGSTQIAPGLKAFVDVIGLTSRAEAAGFPTEDFSNAVR